MDFAKDREELARLEQEEAKAKADYASLGEEIQGLRRELKIAKGEKATVEAALNDRLKEFLKVAVKDHKRDRGALREATKKAAEQARAEFADALKAADLKVKEINDELEKKLHRYNHFFVSYKPEMLKEGVALRVIHLKQFFDMGSNYKTKAVHDISFDIKEGECFGLVGESGCGKTTTGRSIIGLYDITSGSIYYEGYRISAGDRWNRKDDHSFDSYYNVLVGITYKFGTGFNWKCPECKPVVYKNKNTKYSDAYVKSLNDKINELKRQIAEHKCPEPEPCPEVKETTPGIKSHVSFGLAKAAVTEDQQINILAIADYMKQYPESRATVTGYADKATGTDKINDELAAKRAENVANELVNRYGISRDRLTVESKGARIQLFPTNDWNRVVIMIAK